MTGKETSWMLHCGNQIHQPKRISAHEYYEDCWGT